MCVSHNELPVNMLNSFLLAILSARYTHGKVYFIYYRFISTDEDDLNDIVTELESITDVEGLGLSLGLRMSALESIMIDYQPLEKAEDKSHLPLAEKKRHCAARNKTSSQHGLDSLNQWLVSTPY